MNGDGAAWGVILAAGSGSRLSPLTTDATGTVVPKQFCSLSGGPSLLRTTIERMQAVVDPERLLVVVAAAHRRWWEPELADLVPDNVIVQPCDRGTACGVLLPLTTILCRDPMARVVVSPSDHYVQDEDTLCWSLMEALAHVDGRPRLLVLLGMEPDRPDTEYGWIMPTPGGEDAVRLVTSFVEKPDAERAHRLMQSGALWSSFTFVATGDTLMHHFKRSLPWLVERFTVELAFGPWEKRQPALLSLYDRLPTVDFSRRVLERADEPVHVLPVPPCGWTDLGTPQRVTDCVLSNGFPADHCPVPPIEDGDGSPPLRGSHHRRAALDLARAAMLAHHTET